MLRTVAMGASLTLLPTASATLAQATMAGSPPAYDAELARSLGADDRGMRGQVLVILKTEPTPVPAGPERDEMFKGHLANMTRLSSQGTLALAGPLDGVDGWRGLFVLAVSDIEDEYYGAAGRMQVRDTHAKIMTSPS